MRQKAQIFRWFLIILLAASAGFYYGCGSASNEANGGDGSVSTTVGGTTAVGSSRTLNVASNRNTIKVGDQALINISVSCSQADGSQCFSDTSGNLFFSARPVNAADSTQADLAIVANFSISGEATLSQSTSTLTLAAGTRENATASPPVAVVTGASASFANFTATITGTSPGSAVFTAQSLDTIASIIIDVIANTTSPITGS